MQNSVDNSLGFGSLEGDALGVFYTGGDSSSFESIPDIDIDALDISEEIPEFPKEKPLTPAERELKRIAERADEVPSEKKPDINLKLKFMKQSSSEGEEDDLDGDKNPKKGSNKASNEQTAPTPLEKKESTGTMAERKPMRIVTSRTRIEDYGDSQGSINKIRLPKVDEADLNPPALIPERDDELASLAKNLSLFSVEDIADFQVVSPTPAEFIAQYYRVLGVMIAKITLNELKPKEDELDALWFSGRFIKTLSMSQNFVFVFDQIYGYCTQDNVLRTLRNLYEEKRVHFSEMTTHQIMGAGHGISSARQATLYLEKMVAVSISSTISMLSYRRHMFRTRTWFEDSVPRVPTLMVHQGKSPSKPELLNILQTAVAKSSKEQALKFSNNDSVYVKAEHHCLLFAKRYLNTHMSVQIPNNQLQLSALIFLMSGASFENPKIANIGYDSISNNLKDSEALSQSLIDHAYRSHRHCYPINELSKLH